MLFCKSPNSGSTSGGSTITSTESLSVSPSSVQVTVKFPSVLEEKSLPTMLAAGSALMTNAGGGLTSAPVLSMAAQCTAAVASIARTSGSTSAVTLSIVTIGPIEISRSTTPPGATDVPASGS